MSYIAEYSDLSPKEKRQLAFKRRYKHDCPAWDDSMILLKNLLAERIVPNATVLDYGCGHGNFVLDEMGDVFAKKIGVDVDEISVANNYSVDSVVIVKNGLLPFADQSFDVVVSLWALEHFENTDVILREILRVLKPDGIFAFVTPNKNSFLIAMRRLMNKRTADTLLKFLYGREKNDVFAVHYRMNTKSDISNCAARAGMCVDMIQENADPSYTSFNTPSYFLSKIFSALPISFARPHLIGILKKRENLSH